MQERRLDQAQEPLIEVCGVGMLAELVGGPALDERGDGVFPPRSVGRRGRQGPRHGRREVFGEDGAAAGEDHRVFQGVAQLADVAVPGAALQVGERVGGEARRGCPVLAARISKK